MKNSTPSDLLHFKVLSQGLIDMLYAECDDLRAKYINKKIRFDSQYHGYNNRVGKITQVYLDDSFELDIIIDECICISIDDIIRVID